MSKKIENIIYIILIILTISSSIYIFKYCFDMYNTKKERNLLNEKKIEDEKNSENEIKQGNVKNDKTEEKKTERMKKLEKLKKENSDIIGWIEIENTEINYPVLQGNDNSYYMNHNYKKKYSLSGSLFLDKNYSWNPPSSNLLIYGHNMKNGTMFQDLLEYYDKDFYNEHKNIRFTTLKDDSVYEIISAFPSKVYYKSEKNVFKYYQFINAKNKDEYDNFIKNAKKQSLYDTKNNAKYGDQLITLSTCAYHVKNGRFVVIAKKAESKV